MVRVVLVSCVVCLLAVSAASAQQPQPAAPQDPAQAAPAALANVTGQQERWEQVAPGHLRHTGQVALDLSGGIKLFADVVDIFSETNNIVASGNVVFTNPEGRLSAESVEFNLATGTGTFRQASGIMSLGPEADRAQFGNQDPDVYFYGETIERLGP